MAVAITKISFFGPLLLTRQYQHTLSMAGRALSRYVKVCKSCRADNKRMQEAVGEYQREQAKPDGVKRKGLRPIVTKHHVDYTTLSRIAKGKRTMSAYHASRKKLTDQEERVIVNFITESADRGLPLNRARIEATANQIDS